MSEPKILNSLVGVRFVEVNNPKEFSVEIVAGTEAGNEATTSLKFSKAPTKVEELSGETWTDITASYSGDKTIASLEDSVRTLRATFGTEEAVTVTSILKNATEDLASESGTFEVVSENNFDSISEVLLNVEHHNSVQNIIKITGMLMNETHSKVTENRIKYAKELGDFLQAEDIISLNDEKVIIDFVKIYSLKDAIRRYGVEKNIPYEKQLELIKEVRNGLQAVLDKLL